jgi:hypothetical protein
MKIAFSAAALGILLGGTAFAQTTPTPESGAPAPVQNNQTGPSAAPRGGVILTPPNEDPGIQKPLPKTSVDSMPVIKPPGTPGGDQSVQPK